MIELLLYKQTHLGHLDVWKIDLDIWTVYLQCFLLITQNLRFFKCKCY